MEQTEKRKVYLVGAGPGDTDHLTLKAVIVLKHADVVLYDDLVNKECLSSCKEDAIKICVGEKQEEINHLIVMYAKAGKRVVRLKTGTPFVSNSGFEEAKTIADAGFEPVIVSGVSSITSVTEQFMMPLLDIQFNDSCRTINGDNIDLFSDIITTYHPRESLVILMGLENLKNIVEYLISSDFPVDTPLAILSKGTTPNESKIVSTLHEISQQNENFFIDVKTLTPAIIVVGATVNGWNHFN